MCILSASTVASSQDQWSEMLHKACRMYCIVICRVASLQTMDMYLMCTAFFKNRLSIKCINKDDYNTNWCKAILQIRVLPVRPLLRRIEADNQVVGNICSIHSVDLNIKQCPQIKKIGIACLCYTCDYLCVWKLQKRWSNLSPQHCMLCCQLQTVPRWCRRWQGW